MILLARQATADSWRTLLGGQQARPFLAHLVQWFDEGNTLATSDVMSARALLDAIGPMEGLGAVVSAAEPGMAESPGLAASVIEFAAEGLWLTRRIDKDDDGDVITYTSNVADDEFGNDDDS